MARCGALCFLMQTAMFPLVELSCEYCYKTVRTRLGVSPSSSSLAPLVPHSRTTRHYHASTAYGGCDPRTGVQPRLSSAADGCAPGLILPLCGSRV
eukprot:6349889-Prymnesium_polylepis.2